MIGTGIFLKRRKWAPKAKASRSFRGRGLVGRVTFHLRALSYAELGAAIPEGRRYAYLRRGSAQRGLFFLDGCIPSSAVRFRTSIAAAACVSFVLCKSISGRPSLRCHRPFPASRTGIAYDSFSLAQPLAGRLASS